MTGLLTALAFIAGILCERAWRRAGRDMDQAVVAVCKPCSGEAGRCTCPVRCGHPDCTGDHTAFSRAEVRELTAWLEGDGCD